MLELIAAHQLLIAGMLVAGFAAGFAGGLFGIGGGIVTVPVLYAVFHSIGVAESQSLKTAIGTSLAIIVVTSIRSLMTHHRMGHVDMEILRNWAPWISIGAVIGGIAARWAPVELLTIIFAGGAFYIAWRRLTKRQSAPSGGNLLRKRFKMPVGVGTGLFCSLMGLGGGAVGVLVMTASGRTMHQAIATSAGFGIAVAVPGVLGFVWSGYAHTGLPPGSYGYFNLPAFFLMALMAAVAAPLGARFAHRTKAALLSKLFGGYVLLAAISLMLDVFGK